jgi:hypothetical protein
MILALMMRKYGPNLYGSACKNPRMMEMIELEKKESPYQVRRSLYLNQKYAEFTTTCAAAKGRTCVCCAILASTSSFLALNLYSLFMCLKQHSGALKFFKELVTVSFARFASCKLAE